MSARTKERREYGDEAKERKRMRIEATQPDPLAAYRDDTGKLAAYAWPGGYPLYYLTGGGLGAGLTVCPKCANTETPDPAIAAGINWEDAELLCEDCGERIPSAYAEGEARS
jgi:hypothetical protein